MLNLKIRASLTAWHTLVITMLLTLVATRYLLVAANFQAWQVVQFYALASANFFVLALLINLVLTFGLGFVFRKRQWLGLWGALVNGALLVAVVADTFVYDQYRFHLNFAVMDLFINGGGDVISFSGAMWLQIGLMSAGLAIVALGVAIVANRLVHARCRAWPWMLFFVACWIGANFTHAVGVAKSDGKITVIADRVPWLRPVQMNKFFRKTGLVEVVDQVKIKVDGLMNYPLKPIEVAPLEKPMNIVFVWVDSLRADALTPDVMPNTWAIGQTAQRFTNHYSSGNATRAGIFGMFYGLPPTYWQAALTTHTPSAFVDTLLKQNYAVQAFTGAGLNSPEFAQTVFASVPDIRMASEGNGALERDRDAVSDFAHWLDQRDQNKPFFSFIFLDNVHGYSLDPKQDYPFKPHWKTVNNLKLSNDMDPTEYVNLYKNAVHEADRSIAAVWEQLQAKGLLDNTIVVISSDHGEEFNDNKLNYWGHNGNFTDAQIKIPLLIHWPGKAPQTFEHLTTAYDLTATLMPEVLGCRNDIGDFSIGESLWSQHKSDWFLTGSYQRSALVEPDRIVLFDLGGVLFFKERNFQDSENTTRSANLLQAIELFSKYRAR